MACFKATYHDATLIVLPGLAHDKKNNRTANKDEGCVYRTQLKGVALIQHGVAMATDWFIAADIRPAGLQLGFNLIATQ